MILFCCLLILAISSQVYAQEACGTIVGKITDASGGIVPGAAVEVTNKAMGTKTALVTNDQGFYHATYLLSGMYRIEVQMPGFKKAVRDDYAALVKRYYEAGADGYCVWDGERRDQRISEWAGVQRLGHRNLLDRIIQEGPSYHRKVYMKYFAGLSVDSSFLDG